MSTSGCVSIDKTKTPVSGSLSHNAMNAGRVIVVSYVLSRTHRIHQIAITEIARIICSVEPEMLHHFYDEHRTEHRYVWPGQPPVSAVAGFIMRVKFSWGGTETSGTIFCLTMRIISYCQWQIQCQNTVTHVPCVPAPGGANQSKVSEPALTGPWSQPGR